MRSRNFLPRPPTCGRPSGRGGYPAIYDRDVDPTDRLAGYVATYVERDVRQILNVGDLIAFQTFVRLCAGRPAQLLNLSALAASATSPTVLPWSAIDRYDWL